MLNTIVTAIVFTADLDPRIGSPSSSKASKAKTTDASPRGPNQPTNATVAQRCPVPTSARSDGHHAHDGEAGHGVQHDAEVEILEGGEHESGPEDEPQDER